MSTISLGILQIVVSFCSIAFYIAIFAYDIFQNNNTRFLPKLAILISLTVLVTLGIIFDVHAYTQYNNSYGWLFALSAFSIGIFVLIMKSRYIKTKLLLVTIIIFLSLNLFMAIIAWLTKSF